jgi:Flp pilus assembly pilin Flp
VQFIAYALSSLLVRTRGERGQDLLEYALLGGLIAAALLAIGVLASLTGGVQALADGIKACIDFDATKTPCNPPG